MPRRVLEVFLSSTAKDLAEHRKAVHERLMQTGLFHCVRQEDFGAQNADAMEFCRKQAQNADMFVGLIGLRRGWEPDGDNEKRSITEMEHDWARDAGRPRYLWVAPDDFPVPGNMRESDEEYARQTAFRKRVIGGGERIVSQKGFGTPKLLASEIVEHLLVQVVTTDLLNQIRPEAAPPGQPAPSKEEQAPAIAAAVERLVEDKDVDLLALAKNPKDVDVAELEKKLMNREKELEVEAGRNAKKRAKYWRHIGALAFLGDTQKALAAYENATALDPDDPEGWRYLGELHYRLGDHDAARKAFEFLENLANKTGDAQAQSMACLCLCWIEYALGNWTQAELFAGNAASLAESLGWREGMGRAYVNLGNIHHTRGDLDRADDMQMKALKLFEELSRKEGMAATYVNLGMIYETQGDLDRADDMQMKALKLFEELGIKVGMACAYGNLGNISQRRGDLDRADDMQMKSLKLEEELGSKEGMAAASCSLGVIYQTRGDLDRAEDMHMKSLKLEEERGGKEGMARAYCNLGIIYQTRGDLDRADDMQMKALKLNEELGSKEGIARAYCNLGIIYQTRGDLDRAEDMHLKALKLNEELGRKEGMANAYRNLAVIYWDRNDRPKICEYFRKERDLWRAMGLEDKAAEAENWMRLKGCGEE